MVEKKYFSEERTCFVMLFCETVMAVPSSPSTLPVNFSVLLSLRELRGGSLLLRRLIYARTIMFRLTTSHDLAGDIRRSFKATIRVFESCIECKLGFFGTADSLVRSLSSSHFRHCSLAKEQMQVCTDLGRGSQLADWDGLICRTYAAMESLYLAD